MNKIIEELLEDVQPGDCVNIRFGTDSNQSITQGIIIKWSENILSLKNKDNKITKIVLDDLRALTPIEDMNENSLNIDVIERDKNLLDLKKEGSAKSEHRISRQMVALELAKPYVFDVTDNISIIKKMIKSSLNEELRNTLYGILESLTVAVKNNEVTYKYHDLRARIIKSWNLCEETIDYEIIYYLLGILAIISKDYEYSLEPFVRAHKYVLASYAATMGELVESAQVFSLCSLLNGENKDINQYISETCIAHKDVDFLKDFLEMNKNDHELCEKIASCAFMLFLESKSQLSIDITPYFTAYETAKTLLKSISPEWQNKKSALSYWKEFQNYTYPARKMEENEDEKDLVGYINEFRNNEKWGFITSNNFFYIRQIRDDIEEGILLRKMLFLGLWNNLEVNFRLGESSVKSGQKAAYSIKLTQKGYQDAVNRISIAKQTSIRQTGFVESFFPDFLTGRIQSMGKTYNFTVDSIIDPWLRAYYKESFSSREQDVSFEVSGKNAFNICWLHAQEDERKAYANSITDKEIDNWNTFIHKQELENNDIYFPNDDPYAKYVYSALDIADSRIQIKVPMLTFGGKSPIGNISLSITNPVKNIPNFQNRELNYASKFNLSSHIAEGEEFAFLVVSSNHFSKMFKAYEPGFSGTTHEKPIIFETPNVQFSTGKRPSITKSVWLVRFVRKGTMLNTFDGEMYPTVAKGSIITVIKEYRKNNVKRIAVADNGLFVEEQYNSLPSSNIGSIDITHQKTISKISRPLDGETVVFAANNADFSDAIICVYSFINDKYILIDQEGNHINDIDDKQGVVWRFGRITGFEPQNGIGVINNSWSFSLNVATSLLNILKSQSTSLNATVGLYCVFTCENGVISDVRRVREVINIVPWIIGKVVNTNKYLSDIIIETPNHENIVHHSTVETDPYVNRYLNQGILIGISLWIRKVYLCWSDREDFVPKLKGEAIALHSFEQTPLIQYIEKTDSYEGFINQTERFPIIGTRTVLKESVGKKTTVVFTPTNNKTILECRIKGDIVDSFDESVDISDTTSDIADTFINVPLIKLYLHTIDISQTSLRKIDVDENGMPKTVFAAKNAYKQLYDPGRVKYPKNWQNHLFAAKIAIAYPEEIKCRIPFVLLGVLRMRIRAISRNAELSYGELAYGLSILMQYDRQKHDSNYYAWLLLQDFGTAEEILNYESQVQKHQAISVDEICGRIHVRGLGEKLLGHLFIMDILGVEQVCTFIENDSSLSKEVKDAAATICESVKYCESLADVIKNLQCDSQQVFKEYSRNIAELCMRQSDICEEIGHHTEILVQHWAKVFCSEDQSRFSQLIQACDKVSDYAKLGGFIQQENELLNAWRTFDYLEKECFDHPCKISTELLLLNQYMSIETNVFHRLKNEVANKLSRLYSQESLPTLICELNEESISYTRFYQGEADIQLIIRNGDNRHMLQPAENVIVRLESLSQGFHITPEIRLDHKLTAGEKLSLTIYITVDDEETLGSTDIISFTWQAEFLYTGIFEDGHSKQNTYYTHESIEPLRLELISNQIEYKNVTVLNPYKEAALGNPLRENSKVYRHRAEEDTILRSILFHNDDGIEAFRAGATVIVHGQKKSGKTSLINQVKAYIDRNESLRDRAIIIDFDSVLSNIGNVGALPHFIQAFCDAIIQRFGSQLEKHLDVWDMLETNELELPDLLDDTSTATAYARFSRFITTFFKLDKNYHTIILFMDEFTTLCTSLLTEIHTAQSIGDFAQVNYLQHIPDFIKDFSGKGFIQIVIGHESMMRTLDTLGMLNQTKEFATDVLVSSLRPKEAEALIRSPMQEIFGYDPYRTSLGRSAVEYLKDISGCHPTFLARACKEVFDYYVNEALFPIAKTQLTQRDVGNAIAGYVSHLQLDSFDILFVEDGDDVEKPEERKTYQYLKCVAELSLASYDHRTADIHEVTDRMRHILGVIEEERIRGVLQARHIIRFTEGGRLCIETGLFLTYIQQRSGGK